MRIRRKARESVPGLDCVTSDGCPRVRNKCHDVETRANDAVNYALNNVVNGVVNAQQHAGSQSCRIYGRSTLNGEADLHEGNGRAKYLTRVIEFSLVRGCITILCLRAK